MEKSDTRHMHVASLTLQSDIINESFGNWTNNLNYTLLGHC